MRDQSAHITAKPFLKWAGSKRQLLHRFAGFYPRGLQQGDIKNYYEPFLGSAAVFFDLAGRYPGLNAYLSDVNADLVNVYEVLQQQPAGLIEQLFAHQRKYHRLGAEKRANYYYALRDAFNTPVRSLADKKSKAAISRAAQLVFLNRTCFNGLFRVNAKGLFNTPMGRYVHPVICDETNLQAASQLLAGANIRLATYEKALTRPGPASFVYLDPPYRPVSQTANFTAYSQWAFTDKEQQELARQYRRLDEKGAWLMLSNSDTADGFFDKLYKGFYIERIPARRLINSKAAARGPVNEILVTNYTN